MSQIAEQFGPIRMSGADLRCAKIIHYATLCAAALALLCGAMLLSVVLGTTQIPLWIGLPKEVRSGVISASSLAILSYAKPIALWNLRRVGLERALHETRVIERIVAEPEAVRRVERDEARTLRHSLHSLTLIVFAAAWAFFFAGFQLSSIGYESIEITLGYAFLAGIPAAIIMSIYAFATQPKIALDIDESLEAVAWSQVERVEEHRRWNFSNDLAECEIIFRGMHGEKLESLSVEPEEADAIISEISIRLTGRNNRG